MNKNNKGFMLVEAIITSTIILTALIAFYSQFDKLYAKYNERNNFHNVNSLYASKTMFNYLLKNEIYNFNTFLSEKFDTHNYSFIVKDGNICSNATGTCSALCNNGEETCISLKKSLQEIIDFYHIKNMVIATYDSNSLDVDCNDIKCENIKCDSLTGEAKTKCIQAKQTCEQNSQKCNERKETENLKKELTNQTFKDYIEYLINYYDLQNSWQINTENDYNYLIITETEENNETYYSSIRIR